jgi:hypothetical protein
MSRPLKRILSTTLRVFLGFGLMCSAVTGAAAEHTWDMDLRWNFIKLGRVTFISSAKGDDERLEIIGKTAGPLRLVKNYDGRGLLERNGGIDIYTLAGTDGGIDEIRRIVFEQGELPRIMQFKDSNAERPLKPVDPWGRQAWAPMALVQRVLKSANNPELCAGRFTVFDGKRRYKVELSGTRSEPQKDAKTAQSAGLAFCTSVLLGDSLYEVGQSSRDSVRDSGQAAESASGSTKKLRQVWLFGRTDRRIDFMFNGRCEGALLSGMRFYSPIGAILASPIGPCSR